MLTNMFINSTILRLIFIIQCIFTSIVFAYELPNPTIEVLKPRGLRVSIPDAPGLQVFGFHANVNNGIRSNEHGEIADDVYLARNGRWTVENSKVDLKIGHTIHYWIYAQANGIRHKKDDQSWTYQLTVSQDTTAPSIEQSNTHTLSTFETQNERLLFEDNFNVLNESLWTREILMPFNPDYEFCVYHNENDEQLVKIKDGNLIIKPILLEDHFGENSTTYGRLQLTRCTSMVQYECTRQATSFYILPPVISARFTTKDHFTLRYGKIEVRAKFPQGDWLYPEMWLEPKYKIYGQYYASGRIVLGLTRGNENLVNASDVTQIYDSRRLDFGVRVGASPNIRQIFVSKVNEFGPKWTQDFHVYTTIWNQDGFTFLVDNEDVGQLSASSQEWMQGLNANREAAPFDQEFYITLGLGAGGIRVFPDGVISYGEPKPWKNMSPKAMLHFWNARNYWLPSWRKDKGEKTAFVIDYVRAWTL